MEDLGCFAAVTDGFHASLVHQELMTGLRPVGHTRVFIDVITQMQEGSLPRNGGKMRRFAHNTGPLTSAYFADGTAMIHLRLLRPNRTPAFNGSTCLLTSVWTLLRCHSEYFYERACRYVPIDALKEQMAKKFFYTRGLKKVVDQPTMLAHHAAQTSLRQRAQAAL